MIINRYLAGLLTVATSLLTAFTLIPANAWADPAVGWQFGALAVSSVSIIFLKLLKGGWYAALKVGSAVILAIIGALIPLLAFGTFGPLQWALLAVSGLNALAAQLGVDVRIDSAKEQIVSPAPGTTAQIQAVDPSATEIASTKLGV